MKFSDYVKTIRTLSVAMLLGVTMFLGIAYYLVFTGGNFIIDVTRWNGILMYGIFIIGSMGFYISHFIFQKKIDQIRISDESLEHKLAAFRTAHIFRLAMAEGPALAALICYLLFADQYLLVFAAVSIGYMVYMIPSKSTIMRDIGESNVEDDTDIGS